MVKALKFIKLKLFREELRLKSRNVLYPPGLYKGIVWQNGGNGKLLYCGVQEAIFYPPRKIGNIVFSALGIN